MQGIGMQGAICNATLPANQPTAPSAQQLPPPPPLPPSLLSSLSDVQNAIIFMCSLAGKPCKVLLDTGAAHSVVFEKWLMARTRGPHRLKLNTATHPVLVRSASNHLIELRSSCSGVMRFSTRARIPTTLLVAPGSLPGVDIILGMDWMQPLGVVLNTGTGTMQLNLQGRPVQLHAWRTLPAPKPNPGPSGTPPMMPIRADPFISAKQAQRCMRRGADAFLVLTWTDASHGPNLGSLPVVAPMTAEQSEKGLVPEHVMADLLEEGHKLHVFDEPQGMPPDRGVRHAVVLIPGAKPPKHRPYRLSQAEHAEAVKQVNELLQKGLIEPCASPYGAPVLFVQKKSTNPDGTPELRMCIDYRSLNKLTVRDLYPLPRIDDLFDRLRGSSVFSTIDLYSGYHQVPLQEEDRDKTSFVTPFGQYRFKVLCFGLTNAPATFSRVLADVFADFLQEGWLVIYIDDLLIHSKSPEEHAQHLRRVFQRLAEHKLYAKLKKCCFNKPEVEYLGHIVGRKGVAMDPKKVQAVMQWQLPRSLRELQSFLGLANYFRKFIQHYSTTAAPLTTLCGKEAAAAFNWHAWPEKEAKAFADLRQALCSAPILTLPDLNKPFEVRSDASLLGTGAVLMQDGKVIAYHSSKFSKAEVNYTTGEQELLAIIRALQEWRCYLEGAPGGVTLVTDHHPLTYLDTKSTLSRRQSRWLQFLQRFRYTIVYKPGPENIADPISRSGPLEGPPLSDEEGEESDDDAVLVLRPAGWLLLMTRQQAQHLSPEDRPVMLELQTPTRRRGKRTVAVPNTCQEELPGGGEEQTRMSSRIKPRGASTIVTSERDASAHITKSDRTDADQRQQVTAEAVNPTQSNVQKATSPAQLPEVLQALRDGYAEDLRFAKPSFTQHMEQRDGLWYIHGKLFVPLHGPARRLVMQACHDAPLSGHAGIARTLYRLQRHFYWPSLRRDIEDYVRSCDKCQRHKSLTRKKAGEMQALPLPLARWSDISLDLIVKLPTSSGFDSILVIVDRLSKMVHLVPCCESMTAADFARLFIQNVVRLHGLPISIVSDRGTHWNNQFWQHVCDLLGMDRRMSSAFHPETNGQTERMNRVVEEMLRSYIKPDQSDWAEHLPMVEFAINDSWAESIQTTPFFLNHGQHPITPVELEIGAPHRVPHAHDMVQRTITEAMEKAREHLRVAQQRMLQLHKGERRTVEYRPGQQVLLSSVNLIGKAGTGARKLRPRWMGPFQVIRPVGKVAVQLALPPQWTRVHNVFHVSLIKPYIRSKSTLHEGSADDCPPPPIQWLDGEPIYIVDRLLDHKEVFKGKGKSRKAELHFRVRWQGYSEEHDTWEPRSNLLTCNQLIREYKESRGLALSASDLEDD